MKLFHWNYADEFFIFRESFSNSMGVSIVLDLLFGAQLGAIK